MQLDKSLPAVFPEHVGIGKPYKINKSMNLKLNLKSALLGLAVGVIAMLVVAATDSPNPVGRYQVAAGSGFITIVDTTTGQAWGANLAAPAPGFQGVQAGFWEKKVDK